MKLSVVTTLYRSAPFIEPFYQRICDAAKRISADYEIIFVDDGSPDNSLEAARGLIQRDSSVKVVGLSRNFGHHKALMTGLYHATGDLIMMIDVDLEEPPELLLQFYEAYRKADVDVVYGVMLRREGSLFRQASGGLYYAIFNWLSPISLPANVLIARLMSRRYVDALLQHREQVFTLGGLWQLTGFRQLGVAVEKTYKGSTTYSLARRISLLIYSITALSNKPLIYISYLGLLLTIPSGLLIAAFLAQRLFFRVGVDGWTSVIVSLWFLGGLIILVLGIISIYLSVIFTEVKQRPYTIVRDIYTASGRLSDKPEKSEKSSVDQNYPTNSPLQKDSEHITASHD
jgi:putative glycosyltransferase